MRLSISLTLLLITAVNCSAIGNGISSTVAKHEDDGFIKTVQILHANNDDNDATADHGSWSNRMTSSQDWPYNSSTGNNARIRGNKILARSVRKTDEAKPPSHHHFWDPDNCSHHEVHHEPGVHLVSFRWEEIGTYWVITAFVLIAGLCKLGFHHLHWLSSVVPESCLLIVLGLAMGLLIFFTSADIEDPCSEHAVDMPHFTSEAFFILLLPPIILESAYSLHDRAFFDNIGSVLIFAVFGTILNIFIIGPSLYGLAISGAMGPINITLTESLVFSSLISAVDPVAVLTIFQDLGVNKGLYFLVFGESLLNDGVTVVVYNTVSVFMEMTTIKVSQYFLGIVSFLIVAVCGSLIGVIFGMLTAIVTKWTETVRVVEPLALLGTAYLAYLTAELFHFSGIISLIMCGLVQAHYAFQNISKKSYTTVKYFTKMASATSETVIFMFLGMVLVSENHEWHTGFVLWTLLLCLVVRFIITLVLSAATNSHRLHAIDFSTQVIIAYGGLRGAVSFSLVTMLPADLELRELFVSTTLVVILFTVFIQGITIKPLVSLLNISLTTSEPRLMIEEIYLKVLDHMMSGIEEIVGNQGDYYLRTQFQYFNDNYLKKCLLHADAQNDSLKKAFEKMAVADHYANLYGPRVLVQKDASDTEKLVDDESDEYSGGSHYSSDDEEDLKIPLGLEMSPLNETRVPLHEEEHSIEQDHKLLLNMLSSNPYNHLHYTYNKNLVNEDDQEISNLLQRRHSKAKRFSRLAQQPSSQHRRSHHRSRHNSVCPEGNTEATGVEGGDHDERHTTDAEHGKNRGSHKVRSKALPPDDIKNLPKGSEDLLEDIQRAKMLIKAHRKQTLTKRNRHKDAVKDNLAQVPENGESSATDPLLGEEEKKKKKQDE